MGTLKSFFPNYPNVKTTITGTGIIIKTVLPITNKLHTKIINSNIPCIRELFTGEFKVFSNSKNSYIWRCKEYSWEELSKIRYLGNCYTSQMDALKNLKNYLELHLYND